MARLPRGRAVIGADHVPVSVSVPRLGGPVVSLLDARTRDVGEPQLRDWARDHAAASGAAFTSRSYRFPFAVVGWHSAPLGIDIERVEPFDPAFYDSICTPQERTWKLAEAERDRFLASLWCSKEALAKALGDPLTYDPRRLESPYFWPDGRAGRWQAAQLEAPTEHTIWLCWRASGGPA